MRTVTSLILILGLLCSCNTAKKDVVTYAQNTENGLRKDIALGNMVYTFQYKPQDYILKMEHLDSRTEEYKERVKQLQGMAWFNISFTVKGFEQSPLRYQVSGLEEYNSRQDYFLNTAPKDIYMLYGKDTLYVNSYWFENNQNLAAHETMIVGFKLPDTDTKPEKDMQVSYYDRIFKNGIIKIIIKEEDVATAPAS